MNDMGTRTRDPQRQIETLLSAMRGSSLTEELEGDTDDDRNSWTGWSENPNSYYGSTSNRPWYHSSYAYVSRRQLGDAIMKVINLEEEIEKCAENIRKAFQQIDNPDFSPGEEELELYQAWRDSQQWIEKQDELNKSLAKAQRKLSGMEKCVAIQDKVLREIERGPEAGSSNESSSSHNIQSVNTDQQPEHQHSVENPAHVEVIEIPDSSDELSEASPVQPRRPCPASDSQQDDHLSCVICRDDMQAGSTLALECAHVFHSECIETWLKRKKNCPICMRKVSNYQDSNVFLRF